MIITIDAMQDHPTTIGLCVVQGYEPYIISARKNVPWYDERFRGHGRDRIVQTLNMAGFVSFAVHPTAYVVQQPHPQSSSTHFAKGTPRYQEVSPTLVPP